MKKRSQFQIRSNFPSPTVFQVDCTTPLISHRMLTHKIGVVGGWPRAFELSLPCMLLWQNLVDPYVMSVCFLLLLLLESSANPVWLC